MKLTTKHFGEIDYDPTLAIDFPEGLPGFPDRKKFIVLVENEHDDTFCWLQSVDDGSLALALINIYNVMPDYDPLVETGEIDALGSLDGADLLIYNVVVIPDDIKRMRANLRAPIVINPVTRKGKQVVLKNDNYDMRFRIFEPLTGSAR